MVNPVIGTCYTHNGSYIGSCQRVYEETVYEELGRPSKKNMADFKDNYKRETKLEETGFRDLEVTDRLDIEHYLSQLAEFQNYGLLSPTNGLDKDKRYYHQKHLWKVIAQQRAESGFLYLLQREGTTGEGDDNRREVYYGNRGDVSVYNSLVSEDIVKQHENLVMHIGNLISQASKEADTLLKRNNDKIKEIESTKGQHLIGSLVCLLQI